MNQLGDLLFSLPVLSAFKSERGKELERYSCVRPELGPLLAESGLVDGVIEKKRNLSAKIGVLGEIGKHSFKEAVLFSESPESVLLSYLSGIHSRTGFKSSSFSFMMTKTAPRSGVPSLRNNKSLGAQCGLKYIPDDYSGLVKIPDAAVEKAGKWLSDNGAAEKKAVIISAGASKRRKDKCWNMSGWIDVLEFLLKKDCFPVIIGTAAEINEMGYLADSVQPKPAVYAGSDGILFLGALMKRARFFIGIDSGAMHLAASLKLPVIALFGPTDPSQIGPQPLNMHTVIKKKTMNEITADMVFDAAGKFI
ncbi:MAG: glycosyltransferase family 9 protein [Elusimicrobiota bacterium]